MALFRKESQEKEYPPFDKEKIIKQILDEHESKIPNWLIFRSSLPCDLLCVTSTEVNEELRIDNQFSYFRKTVTNQYNILVAAYIEEYIDLDSLSINNISNYISVNSPEKLYRKLKDISVTKKNN